MVLPSASFPEDRMFGYVTPLVPELKVKEYDLYKAVYCGLCRCMGSRVCSLSRFTLSYDFVFLALFRTALTGETLLFTSRRCAAHPFRKRAEAKPNDALRYSAAASALLTGHKVLDDCLDTTGIKRFGKRLLIPAAKKLRRKAALPMLDQETERLLSQLHTAETAHTPSADLPATLFGELLGSYFRHGLEDENKARIAYEIGFHTGKWIYFADAADDLPRDRKEGTYNPLIESGMAEDVLQGNTAALQNAMCLELRDLSLAAELISYPDQGIEAILKNIIYLGMPARFEKICKKYPAKDIRTEKGTVKPHE